MRNSIKDYVKMRDACQRSKEEREFVAPLGDVDQLSAPFGVTSMDITGPYVLTSRKNKNLLTFIDHFTKYVEAIPISDQSAETCARVYASQIVARHGTGSKLITDQGLAFVSTFLQETCKILGIHKVNTTSYHPSSNGMIERFHRTLHTSLSHFVNSANNNWDLLIPFILIAYRETPNITTKYNPFYLLHGREMPLPTIENFKAKSSKENPSHNQRLENLKDSLRSAYKLARGANNRSHQNNKKYYDRKAKFRKFEVNDLV
jgi:transposase InsO family protein